MRVWLFWRKGVWLVGFGLVFGRVFLLVVVWWFFLLLVFGFCVCVCVVGFGVFVLFCEEYARMDGSQRHK